MTTVARVLNETSSHWYTKAGEPFFEIPKKDGSGMRAPTIADARELHLLPSVTQVLGILDKPDLNAWKIEQAVLAVLSTKQNDGEQLDAFVNRVLRVERVQDQEAARARTLGTDIHDAIEKALSGKEWDKQLAPFVDPVLGLLKELGKVAWTEKILVGKHYAGRADTLIWNESLPNEILIDFKTTSRLPDKDSWPEHKLQTAAYAATLGNSGKERRITGNIYISTKNPGQIKAFYQTDWPQTFKVFQQILKIWQWAKGYVP